MRKVVVTEYVTVDGVFEDPGGAEGFRHGGWSFQFWSEEAAKYKYEELFSSDALLLGRVTYEGFAKAWPSVNDEAGFADRMNSLPKFVVSTTLSELAWNNSRLIKGNVAEEVSKLKQEVGQDILLSGSGQLVNALMQYDLIDEYRLMVHPIVLGSGRRIFADADDALKLKLLYTKTFDKGVVLLCYQKA
ncbi:MAG: dihydrofolate reductase family protein [Ktedonobacteraceae bacterium]|nr:dihydrofolate reductase family protein [Ktedonobacteraceae bacterium]